MCMCSSYRFVYSAATCIRTHRSVTGPACFNTVSICVYLIIKLCCVLLWLVVFSTVLNHNPFSLDGNMLHIQALTPTARSIHSSTSYTLKVEATVCTDVVQQFNIYCNSSVREVTEWMQGMKIQAQK
jgi:hypothetical protein